MTTKKKILIIYEYFYPAYKAGGIVQSLRNLVDLMHNDYEFYCITGGYDLNEPLPLEGIQLNCWNQVAIADEAAANVWYDDKISLSPFKLHRLMAKVDPDIVYINGFMSIPFLMNPLWVIQYSPFRKVKTIIAPRGMLQEGALSLKSFKKEWYLKIIRFWNLTKDVEWHITSKTEEPGIKKLFKVADEQVHLVGNIPRHPFTELNASGKTSGKLSLVYASIIAEKKNLLFVLESLRYCQLDIELNIYGVIKEDAYWESCLLAMGMLPSHVKAVYKGGFKPAEMQNIVQEHDAMILMSKGENFAHAIYECLGAGRPVISSHYTSWNGLQEKNAGWNFDVEDPKLLAGELDQLARLQHADWTHFCHGAQELAIQYLNGQSYHEDYRKLFG
ncbi:MAG: glycosyltransferase [Sediminibacterium sp.]|nr:glycosyltransferase [Sediminibacterium sp.]